MNFNEKIEKSENEFRRQINITSNIETSKRSFKIE